MIGMGLQQFFYPGFRPVFVPLWPTWLPDATLFIYLISVVFIFAGASIIVGYKAKKNKFAFGKPAVAAIDLLPHTIPSREQSGIIRQLDRRS